MTNYVNQESFFRWYDSAAKSPMPDKNALLDEVMSRYFRTGEEFFALSPDETATGREEKYEFRFENIGCCGASTFFVYF